MLTNIKSKARYFLASRFTKLRRFFDYRFNAFWFDYPFGKQQWASREEYLQLAKEVRFNKYSQIDEYEQHLSKDDLKILNNIFGENCTLL